MYEDAKPAEAANALLNAAEAAIQIATPRQADEKWMEILVHAQILRARARLLVSRERDLAVAEDGGRGLTPDDVREWT